MLVVSLDTTHASISPVAIILMKDASSYRGRGLSHPELSPQIYVHSALHNAPSHMRVFDRTQVKPSNYSESNCFLG